MKTIPCLDSNNWIGIGKLATGWHSIRQGSTWDHEQSSLISPMLYSTKAVDLYNDKFRLNRVKKYSVFQAVNITVWHFARSSIRKKRANRLVTNCVAEVRRSDLWPAVPIQPPIDFLLYHLPPPSALCSSGLNESIIRSSINFKQKLLLVVLL